MPNKKIVIAGAGGFIGGHLVADFLSQGADVRAVNVKPLSQWFQLFPQADNRQLDLRPHKACQTALHGGGHVVLGRNSNNTLIQRELGWQPSIPLERGLERTYRWIHDQLAVAVAA